MQELAEKVPGPLDAALCMGNSLPHLLTDADLSAALESFRRVLRPGGLLATQVLNYARVLARGERIVGIDRHGERLYVRFYDFRWNETLPEDEFNPKIPRDYRLLEGIDLVVDEEHCLDGLRIFADLVGRYPSTMAYETLKKELLSSPGSRKQDVGDRISDT